MRRPTLLRLAARVFAAAMFGTVALASHAVQPLPSIDPNFNHGLHFVDRFSGDAWHNFVGEETVRLADGSVIVAGRVSWGTQTDPASRMNIGLVRYDRRGHRMPWGTGPDSDYTVYNREYLVYPKASSLMRKVRDIVTLRGFVYVLADRDGVGGCGANCQRDVTIFAFRIDTGAFVGATTVFGTIDDEFAAGLVPIDGGFAAARVLAIGTRATVDSTRPILRQFTLGSTGTLTPSADFPVDPLLQYAVLPLPPSQCQGTVCHVTVEAVGWYGGDYRPTGIYLGGANWSFSGRRYFFAHLGPNGAPVSGFGDGGFTSFPIYSGNDDNSVFPGAVEAVYPTWGGYDAPDTVHFLFNNGGTWVNAARVLGDGTHDTSYGRTPLGYFDTRLTHARDLVVVGDTLYAFGKDERQSGTAGPGDAAIAVLPESGSYTPGNAPERVIEFQARAADRSLYGESIFEDVALDADRRGGWVSGTAYDGTRANAAMFTTLHVCFDSVCRRLFGDGLEAAN